MLGDQKTSGVGAEGLNCLPNYSWQDLLKSAKHVRKKEQILDVLEGLRNRQFKSWDAEPSQSCHKKRGHGTEAPDVLASILQLSLTGKMH